VTANWRKLHDEELCDLYYSASVVGRMRWVGHMACMGEKINEYWVLVGKPVESRITLKTWALMKG
jgi:hypothetical protein